MDCFCFTVLCVAKIREDVADVDGFAPHQKKCGILGLGGRCYDSADDAAEVVDGTVDSVDRVDGAHEEDAAGAGAGAGLAEIRGVAVAPELHVAGTDGDGGVGKASSVLENAVCLRCGVCRGHSLLGCQFVDGAQHGGVDSPGVE